MSLIINQNSRVDLFFSPFPCQVSDLSITSNCRGEILGAGSGIRLKNGRCDRVQNRLAHRIDIISVKRRIVRSSAGVASNVVGN